MAGFLVAVRTTSTKSSVPLRNRLYRTLGYTRARTELFAGKHIRDRPGERDGFTDPDGHLWQVQLSKQQTRELYLNRIFLGAGIYGVEAMSQRVFGKAAKSLSLAESAIIAVCWLLSL